MTAVDRTTLKSYFETGDRPTQSQFGNLIDSALVLSASGGAELHSSVSILSTGNGNVSQAGSTILIGTTACLTLSGSISVGGAASIAGSVLVSGSFIAAGAASFAGSIISVCRVYIGGSDNGGTCNAGLNINQLSSSQDSITLRATGLVIGPCAQHENNVYGSFGLLEACGGFILRGLSSACRGFVVQAFANVYTGVRSTAGRASAEIAVFTSVSSTSNPPADTNIMNIRSGTNTRFIWDSDGDFHADAAVNASAFDSHDDIGLVRSLEVERVKQIGSVGLREEFGQWARYRKDDLEQLKIATFNDGRPGRDNDGSVFVNYTALTRLHSGAIWQLAQKLDRIEKHLLSSGCNYIDLLDSG